MMMFNREYQLECKTVDIYNDLKYEALFSTLDMGVKLHVLIELDKALKKLKAMDKTTEIALITPDFVYNNINKRGMNRTRKILNFCDRVGEEYMQLQMDDPEARKKLIDMIR